MSVQSERTLYGLKAQDLVSQWLRRNGLQPVPTSHKCPYDFTINGKRIEVKAARYNEDRQLWVFNIHRGGKVDESNVDIYVFRLDGAPFDSREAIHLIIPAPVNTALVQITFRGLLTDWARYYNRLELIAPQIIPSVNADWPLDGPTSLKGKKVRNAKTA